MQLNPSCIKTIPIQMYDNDFSFIVNGKEYKTSKLISDLLSPIISQIHANDPTFDTFIINTHEKGNFSTLLKLVNFNQIEYPEDDFPFISEVIEILGNNYIEIEEEKELTSEITIDNVFKHIKNHEKHDHFYSNRLSAEIDFISSHFYELCEKEELISLSESTLFRIINNDQIKLKSEDQLLKFLNKLYSENSVYSVLYENVLFENVSNKNINEFISIYNINDITTSIWRNFSKLFEKRTTDKYNLERYNTNEKDKTFEKTDDEEFKGIINYLLLRSNGQIENEINITASSVQNKKDYYQPSNVVLFDNLDYIFVSKSLPNSWICFDFKYNKVIPTDYEIRSQSDGKNGAHPKNWVIEGSNDEDKWEIISEEKNCPFLNGPNVIHTFSIKNKISKGFRFIRMRMIGINWIKDNCLAFDSFEIYGNLI